MKEPLKEQKMPTTELHYQVGKKDVTLNIYNVKRTLELNEKNEKLRSFNTWDEAIGGTLRKQRHKIAYKKRAYSIYSLNIVSKIVNAFLDMLVEDLIQGNEFVFNPKAKEKERATLRLSPLLYIKGESKREGWLCYSKDRVSYSLQFKPPQSWKKYYHIRHLFVCYFSFFHRPRIAKLVKGGKKYYYTEESKILNSL